MIDNESAAEEKEEIMEHVRRLILATDMSRHADYMAALHALLHPPADPDAPEEPPGDGDGGAAEAAAARRRRLMGELLIKCADTSNVFKPLPVARRWAVRARAHRCNTFFAKKAWRNILRI